MTKTRFDKTKDFKHELIKFFERNKKSSWGRNQVVNAIKDLWIKHLETLYGSFIRSTPMEEREEEEK